MGILRWAERSMVIVICGVQLIDRKRSYLMLCMNETTDRLAMAHSVRWYGLELRKEDGHVLRRASDFEVEDQRREGRPNRTCNRQVEEESVKVGLRRVDALCRSKWSVAEIRLLVSCGESDHSHMLGILSHFKDWCLSQPMPFLNLVFPTFFHCGPTSFSPWMT